MADTSTAPAPTREYVLTLDCPTRPGTVHAVTEFLSRNNGDIAQYQQFHDHERGRFFMRVHVVARGGGPTRGDLAQRFGPLAEAYAMSWHLADATEPVRAAVLVSKHEHCLNDLLFRRRLGALGVDIPLIVSNHPDTGPLAASHGVDFRHVPVTPETRADAEAELLRLVEDYRIDLVVLARYMQVLSPELCKRLDGRAINIHHSFLPSFKGAHPYRQAHARGVKLIGATAHYVTADLDEGPIIEQDVARVNHTMDGQRLAATGRDVEAQVLARAVRWHGEHRVLLNAGRTVVFN
ncbi:formyltetrahydrofolate deformylase [Haloactinospora alba]|uniref:Formyltetrahydrofolate deformylase n=1 Tax=Haloactinospora alba TaxID=405555 RepID=A0A543NK17_9ACTN|nr:formyltetrahydrofolate deformylase [Haloactinospora alba]TQN32169.1 formyltetrahydrofolate deformylase [Haloactinospora alba]